MKNWKKITPKKVAQDQPFFPQSSPGISPQPKIDFPYYEISGPDICSLICALTSEAEANFPIPSNRKHLLSIYIKLGKEIDL